MASVISGDANVSATEFGFLDGVTSSLQSQIDSKLPLAGGKILQIVRATDATLRTTTSTSYVDANISVTITPQKSDSSVLLIWLSYASPTGGSSNYQAHQITDNSNNAISGAQATTVGSTDAFTNYVSFILLGYATPATTSPVTYKGRFSANTGVTARLSNNVNTGQMYAIEVSA